MHLFLYVEKQCLEPLVGSDMSVERDALSQRSTATFACVYGFVFANGDTEHESTCVYEPLSDTIHWIPDPGNCLGNLHKNKIK